MVHCMYCPPEEPRRITGEPGLQCLTEAASHRCFREDRGKVLVGLNFYGRDFSPSGVKDVLGHDYNASLERDGAVLHWDEADQEHQLTYKEGVEEHVVYYPSTKALQVSQLEQDVLV